MEEIKAKWVFEQGGFSKAVIAPTPMGAGYHLHLVKFGRNAETEVLERQRGGWRVFKTMDAAANRGCKPEPPKFPSCQFHPFHKGIQVNHLAVTLKGIVSVQQNVSPGCRRYLGERRERLGVTCCFALR